MSAALRLWYKTLSEREQRLIMVAGVLLVVAIVWGSIVIGYGSWSSARSRHVDAVRRLADTQTRVKAVDDLRRARPEGAAGPIEAAVREKAASAGFILGNVTPQVDDSVDIAIPAAKPAAFFAWAALLEEQGLIVTRLTTSNNGDRTLSVQMSLKKQGK